MATQKPATRSNQTPTAAPAPKTTDAAPAAPTAPPSGEPAPAPAPAPDGTATSPGAAKPKAPPAATWVNRTRAAMKHVESDAPNDALKAAAKLIGEWVATLPADYNAGPASLKVGDSVFIRGYDSVLKAIGFEGKPGTVKECERGWCLVTFGETTFKVNKTDCSHA